jgi:hypothetical protein
MGVRNSGLDGPRTPSRNVQTFPQRQRRILVPDNEPVVVRRLVEKCCAKWDRGRGEESTCDRNQAWIVRDAIDEGVMHQMASAGSTAIDRLALKRFCDARDLSSGQY